MYADIKKTCVEAGCGQEFWWTAGEQEYFEAYQLKPPRRCPDCRNKRRARQDQNSTALVPAPPVSVAVQAPKLPASPEFPKEFTDRAALFADIQQLLKEATAAVIPQKASFFQRLFGVDPTAEQLARKMEAARTADELVQQRTALFEHLQQMVVAATNAELARMHAHIKLEEAQLRALELQEQINQRHALSGDRLKTQQLREHLDQKTLRDAVIEVVQDPNESVIQDYRRSTRSRAKAGQTHLSDFLAAVEEVCGRQSSMHEKALRIRNLLDSFEMSEDELPQRARQILESTEAING